MSELFKVSSNPHIRSKVATNGLMLAVVTALMPAAGFGIYNFGPRALAVIVVTMASTGLTEYFFGLLTKKLTVKVNAFSDGAKAKIEAVGGTCEVV